MDSLDLGCGTFANFDYCGQSRAELKLGGGRDSNGELNRSAPGADGVSAGARHSRLRGDAGMCSFIVKLRFSVT